MCRQLIYLVCFVLVLSLAATSASDGEAPDPDVAWWKLDEGSGDNVVDSTGNGNDGTITDAVWRSPGFDDMGWCLGFNGSGYVNCGNDDSLNFGTGNWTVSAWVKTTVGGESSTIFANGGDQSGGIRYTLAVSEVTDGIVTLTTDDNSTKRQATGTIAVNDDVWHLVVGVRDGTTLRVYVDGEQDGTNSVSITYDLSGTSQHDAYIGAITDNRDSTLFKYFVGLIDDVRVYSYVLSADQIKALIPPKLKAYDPDPPDGAENVTSPLCTWTSGDTAASHDIYFGTNPTPGAAEFKTRQPLAWNMYFHQEPLIAGVTYYWRVDEVELDGTTIHTGDVWSFTVPVLTASNPSPPDGATYVATDVELSWDAGFNAVTHDVYFGTDETAVTDGTGGTFKGNQPSTIYGPGTLAKGTTYYWRVDEDDLTTKHAGEVWSFTTVPDIPITDPDLLCWWKFDEGMGTTAPDSSGHDNHGTLVGPPQWVDGLIGGALEFGGDGDHVVDTGAGSYLNGLDAVTFCVWIKSDITGTDKGFLICDTSTGDDRNIRYDAAGATTGGTNCMKYGITTTDADPEDESPSDTQTTEWQHVALAWSDGGQLQLYLNGVLTLSPQPSAAATGTLTGYTQLVVGKGCKDSGGSWDGLIDDVRVYSKALTGEEIKEVMRGEPDLAWNPRPAHRSTADIDEATTFSWSPGDSAVKHDVSFGTDEDAVIDADSSDTTGVYRGRIDPNSYTPPEGVEFGQTYYWRIDEYNSDATISKGRIWSFTVADYLIIDDFEDYDDYCNRVFYTYGDGWGHNGDAACGVPPSTGNGTGSTVGYLDPPYAEQTVTHDASFQSMPFEFLNDGSTGKARYSETERTFDPAQDWTRRGVKALTLYFYGVPGNAAERMYVALEDSAGHVRVVEHPDPEALQRETWQEWNIELKQVSDASVNLQSVKKMYIGVGNRNLPTLGGGGMLYIDDIRLYRPRCVPLILRPDADIARPYDCKVDYKDLRVLTYEWLSEAQLQDWEYRAAYWDSRYPVNWGGNGIAMRDGLAAAGYTIVNADQLRAWMDDRIADGKSSVVVICRDSAPDTIAESMDTNCTIRRYLDAGGKVVWYADIPFYYQAHSDGTQTTWGEAGQAGILEIGNLALWDSGNTATITDVGANWGLTQRWTSVRAEDANDVDVILATDNSGNAAAYVLHFVPGDAVRGFVRLWDQSGGTTPSIADVIRVAEYGALAADLNGDGTVDFKDYAVLTDMLLDEVLWP